MPVVGPAGALGDISSALFAVIGVLAALRHRDRTGEGQYVDIAMFDSMVAMTDLVTNFWSMGERKGPGVPLISDPFRAADGWFVAAGRPRAPVRAARRAHRPAGVADRPEASRPAPGWLEHLDDGDPARGRGLGRRQDEARGRARHERRGHRRRAR